MSLSPILRENRDRPQQAVVGVVEPLGGGDRAKFEGSTPCKADCPCTAARDAARGREAGASAGRQQWRTVAAGLHGGPSPGALIMKGNRNAFKHGGYTAEAIASCRDVAALAPRAGLTVPPHE
jgi:hypothetical protein